MRLCELACVPDALPCSCTGSSSSQACRSRTARVLSKMRCRLGFLGASDQWQDFREQVLARALHMSPWLIQPWQRCFGAPVGQIRAHEPLFLKWIGRRAATHQRAHRQIGIAQCLNEQIECRGRRAGLSIKLVASSW